jgi:glutaredoxin 3
MYQTAWCPYCRRAESLLRAKGVREIEMIDIDLGSNGRAELVAKTGRRTVPQIFIDGTHVGGCDDLYELDRRGGLDPLLASAGAHEEK